MGTNTNDAAELAQRIKDAWNDDDFDAMKAAVADLEALEAQALEVVNTEPTSASEVPETPPAPTVDIPEPDLPAGLPYDEVVRRINAHRAAVRAAQAGEPAEPVNRELLSKDEYSAKVDEAIAEAVANGERDPFSVVSRVSRFREAK